MKKMLTNIPLTISSLILIAGVILGILLAAQYYLEFRDPPEWLLRFQVSQTYKSVTEADIAKVTSKENCENLTGTIKVLRSIAEDESMMQFSKGFCNAKRIAAKKYAVILEDIEADRIDEFTAMAAARKVEQQEYSYRDIFDTRWEGMRDIFDPRPTERWLMLDILLLVIGTVLLVRVRRRKRVTAAVDVPVSPETKE